MPSVVQETAEVPAKLERVEVEPGVVLKLTAKDAADYKARLDREEGERAAYRAHLASDGAPSAEAASDVVPLTILTKVELQELAEKRGLATSGSKDAIAARFVAGDEADDDDEADADDDGEAQPA